MGKQKLGLGRGSLPSPLSPPVRFIKLWDLWHGHAVVHHLIVSEASSTTNQPPKPDECWFDLSVVVAILATKLKRSFPLKINS